MALLNGTFSAPSFDPSYILVTAHRVELLILTMRYFMEGVVYTSKMTFGISFVIALLNILLASVIWTHTIIRQGLELYQEINKIDCFDNNSKAPH